MLLMQSDVLHNSILNTFIFDWCQTHLESDHNYDYTANASENSTFSELLATNQYGTGSEDNAQLPRSPFPCTFGPPSCIMQPLIPERRWEDALEAPFFSYLSKN